jgi:uncharacterized RDD family membrane protein YckC
MAGADESYTGNGPSGPRAGFWRRFAGALIDGIILGIVGFVVRLALGAGGGSGIGLAVAAVYFTLLIGRDQGQTLGQMVMGIRVIDFGGGGAIGYGRAFLRWVVSYVSGIVILLGYLWMLWDREKQTWHDKAANAVVVPVDAYPVR